MPELTRRQRIAKILANSPNGVQPSTIEKRLYDHGIKVSTDDVLDDIEHIHESLEEQQVGVTPPLCRECGFDRYSDLLNVPSSCPECNGERIAEPRYIIGEGRGDRWE